MKNPKQLYRGIFNYKHSLHILYCYATTERGAWKNFCFTLSKKHQVDVWHVMNIFKGDRDNFKIEEVKNVEVRLVHESNRGFV